MFFKSKTPQPPAMTLEGVLGPNGRLDEAKSMPVDQPRNLCVTADGNLVFSAGKDICVLKKWAGKPVVLGSFAHPVSALCTSPGGLIAVGMAGGAIAVCDADGRPLDDWAVSVPLQSVNDCAFLSEDEIAVADCGYANEDDVLSIAPWDEVARGRVVAIARSGKVHNLGPDLHAPMGLCRDAGGKMLVTLMERAAITDVTGQVQQGGYPAYLGRLRKTATGYVMACLARRDPLIEFLKTEKEFVAEMKASMASKYWISPRANPEFSHEFPIELGATRLFGEIKPWAPSFSYGLVIEMDENLMPVASAHSRANKSRHAITDVLEWQGDLIVVSKASGEILNLGPRKDAA